jgi:hypothetical protein
MSKVKVVLNSDGVRELLKSEDMQRVVSEQAHAIAGRCGAGYSDDVYVGKNRCNAMIYPETSAAKRDNLENNTILKAMR